MAKTLGHKAASGAMWATISRFSSMAIQFLSNLILARLLLPEDYGIIGMLAIFIAISQTLIEGGFGSALIQKKNPSQTDYSTVFYWSLAFSTFLYILLFLLASVIANFYGMLLLKSVLRVVALSLIINSITSIQRIRLQKQLAFKTLCIISLSAYIISSGSGILLAYEGYGVWSLVAAQLISGSMSLIFYWFFTHWMPSLEFSKSSMKELFSFGGFIMAANILQTISQNLQGIIIGKKFSATQMGYFSQAYKLDQVTSYTIPQVIVQVMYPVFSSVQDDTHRLNNIVLMNLRIISFIVFPILSLLIITAKNLIVFLYGETWEPSAIYFQILCVGGFFLSLQNINFYAVAAVGKSKSLFKWSFYKWGFLLVALLVGMNLGMLGLLWAMVLSNANLFLCNSYLSAKHTGLRMSSQLKALFPVIGLIICSVLIAYLSIIFFNNIFIASAIFTLMYISLSFIFKPQAFSETKQVVIRLLHK